MKQRPFNVLNDSSVYVLRGVLLKTQYVRFSYTDLPTRRLYKLFNANGDKIKEVAVPHMLAPEVFSAAQDALKEFKKDEA